MAKNYQKGVNPAKPSKPTAGNATRGTQDPDGHLSAMQKAFVHNLVNNGLTQTAAARAAGFAHPGQQALELLDNPKVQKAIATERAAYAQSSGMTKQKVIDGLAEAIDLARITADPTAMIGGWREIGKLCGFYEPTKTKIEVSLQGKVLVERLNTMTDEELLALADQQPDALEGEFHVIDESGQ